MGHILRIDSDKSVVEENYVGWTDGQVGLVGDRIETISDTIRNQDATKVGTAIPSPFARLYIFDTAFRIVANEPEPAEPTLYHTLVSHCLDLLELLFQRGAQQRSELTFKVWQISNRLEALESKKYSDKQSSQRHPHQILAKALNLDLQGQLSDLKAISLIYYKGVLLGGTSPFSLVYTSPNLQRDLLNKLGAEPILGATGKEMFQAKDYVPLADRDKEFVTYLKHFYDTYKDKISEENWFVKFLYKQFSDNGESSLPIIDGLTIESFDKINTADENIPFLEVLPEIHLLSVSPEKVGEEIERTSDFVMKTSVDHYKNERDSFGAKTNVKKPLALVSKMLNRGLYTKNTQWHSSIEIPSSIIIGSDLSTTGLLAERRLPGTDGTTYPFVTTDDFLESFLVKMPFPLNNQRFHTGTKEDINCPYLLPIKKEYFNFFTEEDLAKNFKLIMRENEVEAILEIPVSGARTGPVKFKKTYSLPKRRGQTEANEFDMVLTLEEVGLGFFPFYQLTSQTHDQSLYKYTVLLADGSPQQSTDLAFFRYEDIIYRQRQSGSAKPEPRSVRTDVRPASYFYKLNEAFNLIEFSFQKDGILYKGLIIPKFIEIETIPNRGFTFAIDFGTSNTHVALKINDLKHEPETLKVSDEQDDVQVVLLNKPYTGQDVKTAYDRYSTISSFGSFDQFQRLIRREFVPILIGAGGSPFAFPLRTAVLEQKGFPSQGDHLFSKLNLGFNIELEQIVSDDTHYETDLKWLFENKPGDAQNDQRIRVFFETLLLLIRHKIIQNKGDITKTVIIWLKPSSMGPNTLRRLQNEWLVAMKNVFGTTDYFDKEPILESLAPYFYLQTKTENKFLRTSNSVNIDIGGGTSDIMVFAEAEKCYINTSFRFAANDIWGAGLNEKGTQSKAKINGFTLIYKQYLTNNSIIINKNTPLGVFLDEDADISADNLVNLIFKHEQHQFRKAIQNEIILIPLLHYAAIIYHLVQFLKEQKLPFPEYLSFTGLGSRYLKLLGTETEIVVFTDRLLRSYTNQPVPFGFKIITSDYPKETTANGAILFRNAVKEEREPYLTSQTKSYWGARPEVEAILPFLYNVTKYSDLTSRDNFHSSVIQNVEDFLSKTLKDPLIESLFNEYGIKRPQDYFDYLTGNGEYSLLNKCYKLALEPINLNGDQKLVETFFFLPLKHALYMLAMHIAENQTQA